MPRVLVPLVALSCAAACMNRNSRSIALYEAGDFAGAAREADAGLRAHPRDDGLWQMRIRAALALGDGDALATAYAAHADQRDGDDRPLLRDLATATLGQALASPSVRLKISAIEAVAAAEIHALADQVAERMGDDDDRVAAAAAVAVLRGFPEAPRAAADMLRSEDPEARRIAVDGVGKKIGALAAADLIKAASDPDPRVRRAAVRWLGQLKLGDAAELLARHLHGDPDEGVRAAAASGLARIGGELAAPAARAIADRALAVRLAGIDLLVAANQRDQLIALGEDPDPMVAAEAALAARRDDLAIKALDRAVAAEAWTVRAGAANLAVRALGKSGGLALARRLLGDPEIAVRLAAARVLAHAGDRDGAIAVFAAALTGDAALAAATDLAALADERGLAALAAAVRDGKRGPAQRAQAATAHRIAHRITAGLVAALADPSGVVRVEAAAVIAMLAK